MADLKFLPHGDRLLSGKLLADITFDALTATVNNPPTASKLPTYFEFEYGSDDAEVVRIIAVSGSTITMERGVNLGGVGKAHQQNDLFKEKITNYAWNKVVDAMESGYLTEDTSYTFAQVSTSSFKVTASGVDRTGMYSAGRRIRLNGSIIVHISSSAYVNPDTTVTVRETTVPASITSIELEIGTKANFYDLDLEHNAVGTHKETALDSMITGTEAQGDIIYHNGTIWTRLPKGTDGQVLTQASNVPSWASTSGIPTGSIIPFASSTAPTGYLVCNGATVSQATYAALYALIGHTYGADPGGGNFILPNLKGKVVVGLNASETEFDAMAETGGEKTHVLTEAELAQHTHIQNAHTHGFTDATGTGGTAYPTIAAHGDAVGYNPTSAIANATPTNQNTGSNTAHNNLQPYITLQYIIKT